MTIQSVRGGIMTGGFTDHHVHLQLVDASALATSRLARVIDLGADPAGIRTLAARLAGAPAPSLSQIKNASPEADSDALSIRTDGERIKSAPETDAGGADLIRADGASADGAGADSAGAHVVRVAYAGPFLTAPGGYPSDRAWAPEGSWREVADAADAADAVPPLVDAGVSVLKVASNSAAGPVPNDEVLRAFARLADAHDIPLVVHAEGGGQAERARRLGAHVLAHAPFSERLADVEIAAQAASVRWISTLAIHDPEARGIAIDNVRRFHAAGGTVLYGTDMGNGPGPVDLREDELSALREAGLDDTALLRALAPTGPPLLFLPNGDPARAVPLVS